jgi:fucose permease
MKKRQILLLLIIYGAMLTFGFTENIKGVSYPLLNREFGASYSEQGLIVGLSTIGYVVFCLLASLVLSKFGIKRAFVAGFLLLIAGLILIFFMPGFYSAMFALIVIFAAFGFLEIGINAAATRVFTTRSALLMSLLHFFYGAGSVLSPQFAKLLLSGGFSWRHSYLFTIPLAVVVLLPTFFAKFPEESVVHADAGAPVTGHGMEHVKLSYMGALRRPDVWVLGLALGFGIVTEMSIVNWGGLYFADAFGLDPGTAGANMVSIYFALFTASRLVSGFVIEKIGYMRSLICSALLILAIYVTAFASGTNGIYIMPAMGFFTALAWPTLMAVGIKHFGIDAAVATSASITISGALTAAFQYLTGLLSGGIGSVWGFRSTTLYAGLYLLFLVMLSRLIKRQPVGT